MTNIDMGDLLKQVAEDEHRELEAYSKGAGEAPIIFRQVSGAVQKMAEDGPITFTLSDESEDRMGDVIRQDGWELDSFRSNPVMLWAHNGSLPPIGKWANLRHEGVSLVGDGIFDDDTFSRTIENKVRRGFLNAVSVGFRPTEFKRREGDGDPMGGFEFIKQELLETSVVPVPAHPRALRKALAELDAKQPWFFMPSEFGFVAAPIVEGKAQMPAAVSEEVTMEVKEPDPVAEPDPEPEQFEEPAVVNLTALEKRVADLEEWRAETVTKASTSETAEVLEEVGEGEVDSPDDEPDETLAYREHIQRVLRDAFEGDSHDE